MSQFAHYLWLSSPLFGVVLLGYLIALWKRWRTEWTRGATRLIFGIALPALLFNMMSDRNSLPPVDARLLLAFFGGCLVVFVLGRVLAARVFELDGVAQSVFALGGIFSNNVMLGLPLAQLTLGAVALPSVALVLVFNALTLWTLASVSVEWSHHGSFSVQGFARTAYRVLTNPIVASILIGSLFGLSGFQLPDIAEHALQAVGSVAAPGALLVLGMGLSEYSIKRDWQQSVAICSIKLLVQPLVVWALGVSLGLPPLELKVVVLLASTAVGANVYLMAIQFERLQGTIATSLVLSTVLASVTTPLLLTFVS